MANRLANVQLGHFYLDLPKGIPINNRPDGEPKYDGPAIPDEYNGKVDKTVPNTYTAQRDAIWARYNGVLRSIDQNMTLSKVDWFDQLRVLERRFRQKFSRLDRQRRGGQLDSESEEESEEESGNKVVVKTPKTAVKTGVKRKRAGKVAGPPTNMFNNSGGFIADPDDDSKDKAAVQAAVGSWLQKLPPRSLPAQKLPPSKLPPPKLPAQKIPTRTLPPPKLPSKKLPPKNLPPKKVRPVLQQSLPSPQPSPVKSAPMKRSQAKALQVNPIVANLLAFGIPQSGPASWGRRKVENSGQEEKKEEKKEEEKEEEMEIAETEFGGEDN